MTIEGFLLERPNDVDFSMRNRYEVEVPKGLSMSTDYTNFSLQVEDVSDGSMSAGGFVTASILSKGQAEVRVEGAKSVVTRAEVEKTTIKAEIGAGKVVDLIVLSRDEVIGIGHFAHKKG